MKPSGFCGDLTTNSTNAGNLNTVAVTGIKTDSGMFAGQTQLENGRKMLESFNKIYSFLDFFDRYISILNAEKTSLRLFVAGQPSCQLNHFLYPGKG